MENRPLCPTCSHNPVAVNCRNGIKTYYRKQCDACIRKGKKIKPPAPGWFKLGYRKKPQCERCGFKAVLPNAQLNVFHVDGNLKNNDRTNLKTICLNCTQEVYKSKLPWKSSPVVPDF